MNPYGVVENFESEVCKYTGARYCVTTNSCTMALLLACKFELPARGDVVEIPKRTYVSVPMSIIHAGGRVTFRDDDWVGSYRLWPLGVWDCARWFTAGMYAPNTFQCVSFHASKTLGDTQGGAILHDNDEADAWFRRMRFDGRTAGVAPKDDDIKEVGYHCYMSSDVAARLLLKFYSLPDFNAPLPNDDYPDLSLMEVFK